MPLAESLRVCVAHREVPGTSRPLRGLVRRAARALAGAVLGVGLCAAAATAQTIREDFPITNGTVNAVVQSGNTLYLGGSFTAVGATTGTGVPLSAATGSPVSGFPRVNGQVNAVVADGAGGWFIGGAFTSVGGVARANIARILADNSVAAWNPAVGGQVLALAFDGSTLYAGGSFNLVGGLSRSNIAAISGATGVVSSWDPGASSSVRTLALGGSVIYAGGSFTSIGASTRMRIAAISVSTGAPTSWNPNAGSTVRALAVSGSNVYAAGDFTTIGGQSRLRVAALDASSGSAISWNPGANAQVSSLALSGSTLYAGGSFTTFGGQPRNRLASVGATTGTMTSWNPNANAQVLTLAVDGAVVYAGGDFLTAGGQARSRIAALDAATGVASAWNPNAYGSVFSLAASGGLVYAAGSFTGMGGVLRNNLASIDIPSGQVTSWNPDVNGEVLALTLQGGRLYAGGSFTSAGIQTRNGLAAFDLASGLDTGWNPNVSGHVSALAAGGGRVYAGGVFGVVGGQSRTNLASLDPVTGTPDAWNPGTDGEVFSLAVSGSTVYAGGTFMTAAGALRNNLAALDAATGNATAWDPNASGTVRAIELGCGKVYVGGFFTTIGGQTRNRAARLDAGSGNADSWDPNSNGPVFAMRLSGPTVYVAGVLSFIGGQARNRLAALSLTTGSATSWNPNSNGTIRALEVGPAGAYVGGSFTTLGTTLQTNIAAVDLDHTFTCPLVTFSPPSLPALTVGTPFSQALSALGGVGPYCLALSGTLPPGLAFDTGTGALSGTPTTGGSYASTVTATDANGCAGSQAYTLGVSCPAIALSPALLQDGAVGAPYSQPIAASAGTAPRTWAVSSGSLPDGLVLGTASGVLSGTPTTEQSSVFTVTVTDAFGCTGSENYSMDVFLNPPASVVAANTSTVCISSQHPCVSVPFVYSRADSAPARGISVTFQIDTSKLALCAAGPAALSIHPGPWLAAYANPNFQVLDNGGGSYTVDQAIFGVPCGITTGGVLFTVDLKSAGADGSGAITVTRVKARDCSNVAIAASPGPVATLTVHNAPIVVLPASLPDGPVNEAYTHTITASPGSAPITFAVTAGSLPPGLVLAPDGGLSGTPSAYGTYAFTVTATDAGGCTGLRAYSVTFACPAIAVLPPTLPNPPIGVPYAQAITNDGGSPPVTFTIAAGSLPPGLLLSPAGALSGTPATAGTYSFTVRATAAGGCFAERPYDIAVACPAMVVIPSQFADGVLGQPFAQSASASAGIGPFTWGLTAGTLPAGLALDSGTGEISGTPTAAATSVFTLLGTDAFGCIASESYTLSILAAPPSSSVAADATGLCLSTANTCVSVPFLFARGETAPARGVSVTFQLDAGRLALCTPGSPSSSVHPGSWLAGYTNTQLLVTDRGAGRYTVDLGLLGTPCGVVSGGQLFTIDVQSVGGDGTGTIAVTSAIARDCENIPIGVLPGPAASLSIQHAAPAAITDLASEQVLNGNPPGSTTGITLTWVAGGGPAARLYRAPFGSYPLYDANGPLAPPDPLAAPASPWALVSAGTASGYVDHPPARGWWHYVAFAIDSCGNLSAVSNPTPGALDYHLGDVSNGVAVGVGDNRVSDEDVSLLGANYGIGEPAITTRGVAYLDIGPTVDYLPSSRPQPDHMIDFEDFILFAANYQVTSGPQGPARPAGGEQSAALEEFRVGVPALVQAGQAVTATIGLTGSGHVQGFSATLGWDAGVVQPVSFAATPWFLGQDGLVLSARPGKVDAALLGARQQGLFGPVDVATVTFQALTSGAPGIRIANLVARDAHNQPVPTAIAVAGVESQAVRATEMSAPWPNPARGGTTIDFALARAGRVELAIYGIDGRLVKTLAQGERETGRYRLPWDGTDDRGQAAAPGVYYARLRADGREFTKKLVRLER
jgi:hypothetical protein